MYLPTFWKLTTEATMYRGRHMAGWLLPASLMVAWIGFPSFYNWTYTTIIPPPTGVAKRHGKLDWARFVETDRVRFSGLILFYVLLNLNTSCLGYTMVQKSLLLFYGLTSLIISALPSKLGPQIEIKSVCYNLFLLGKKSAHSWYNPFFFCVGVVWYV